MIEYIIPIITGFISAATSIFICIVNNNKQIAIIETKLDFLSKSIDKNSDLLERVIVLENDVKNIKEDFGHA